MSSNCGARSWTCVRVCASDAVMATTKKAAPKKTAPKKAAAKKVATKKTAAHHDHDDNYTDPALRERIKQEVLAGDKGGRPGQWSARKAQLVAHEYTAQGTRPTRRRSTCSSGRQKSGTQPQARTRFRAR